MTLYSPLLLIAGLGAMALAQVSSVSSGPGLLARRYLEGEQRTYQMRGQDRGVRYEVQANIVVKRDAAGKFIEEIAWLGMVRNGTPLTFPAAAMQFRQIVSLDPDHIPSLPNFATVHPSLIGPAADMLTFYVDLWLAIREAKLTKVRELFYYKAGMTASWADGNRVILGEDAVDFEIQLTDIDKANQIATLSVRHVPPRESMIKLPAPWMRERVADTENNWIHVIQQNGKYVAAVGKETFDVVLKIRLADGVILSGTLDNPVEGRERDCNDKALLDCGEPRPYRILRRIEIDLLSETK